MVRGMIRGGVTARLCIEEHAGVASSVCIFRPLVALLAAG